MLCKTVMLYDGRLDRMDESTPNQSVAPVLKRLDRMASLSAWLPPIPSVTPHLLSSPLTRSPLSRSFALLLLVLRSLLFSRTEPHSHPAHRCSACSRSLPPSLTSMASERRATTATSGEPLPPYLPSLLCDLHAPEDDGYGTTFQRGRWVFLWI